MEIIMSQYRSSVYAHTIRQSQHRASINPSKSFGGIVAGRRNGGSKKSK